MAKPVHLFIGLVVCSALTGYVFAQPETLKHAHDAKNCHHLLSNYYQCNWKFIRLPRPSDGIVIRYNGLRPGEKDAAAVSLVKMGMDTVRVILLSNATHKPGDRITITPVPEPDYDIMVPIDRDFYLSEEKAGRKPFCRIDEYDSRVLKTTWGRVDAK